MEWFKVAENPPPENMDILGYTEERRLKTFRSYKGKFDTYQTIVWWAIPDLPPEDEKIIEEPKKRGRKKKA